MKIKKKYKKLWNKELYKTKSKYIKVIFLTLFYNYSIKLKRRRAIYRSLEREKSKKEGKKMERKEEKK